MTHVKFDASKSDVIVDVYIRPLLFLLRRLKAVDGQDAEIVILPSFGVRSGELALLSSKGVKPVSGLWRWLLRRCIITGYPENKRDLDDITFDFFGEAYDALND
ncbi:hypothetical protein, partial [Klebsiella pneumoniae]